MEEKKRTKSQNDAMHVYFAEMSQLLTESGLDVHLFLKDFEISYSPKMLLDIWRAIAKQKFNKEGTSKLSTTELQEVYEEFNRQTTKHGLHLPFPSNDTNNFNETFK